MELMMSSDSDSEYCNTDDVANDLPVVNSQITNCSSSKKRFISDVWNYFSLRNDKATCKCGQPFHTRQMVPLVPQVRIVIRETCTVKNDISSQAGIVYNSFSNSLINA
jgi:hypothetical protein